MAGAWLEIDEATSWAEVTNEAMLYLFPADVHPDVIDCTAYDWAQSCVEDPLCFQQSIHAIASVSSFDDCVYCVC